MTLARRALLGAAGVAALGAGAWWSNRRLQPASPQDTALANFWTSEFKTPHGAGMPMAPLQGRPLLINFWATWCPPCVKEMPELDRFATSFAPKGGQVLGIAIDQSDAVNEFLARTPVKFPIVLGGLGGLDLVKALGNAAGGLPFSVLIDAKGRVAQVKMGSTTEVELEQWAKAL
ncbi:MAG: redoxin [Burkholderiales bacterium PBB6]|jgi:thiol-disulfide isomerase/thioredoxin|nr:MAG: redoxin [Burkholderiales bacterium PBB6]